MEHEFKHLERRRDSNYKQLFVKGVRIRAEVLYRETLGEEARTPEELAHDFDLPVEAVREAIEYCERYPEVLREDFEREEANLRAYEKIHPPLLPPGFKLPA